MGSTVTEKIIAAHAGVATVRPGEIVNVKVDATMSSDGTGPMAIKQFKSMGATRVFDRERVGLFPGRRVPAKDINSAIMCQELRQFAREQGLKHYYEAGRTGIDMIRMVEVGLVKPGWLIAATNSHLTTLGAFGALAVPMGSTDAAYIFAFGETWLRVPETYRFVLRGKLPDFVMAKDVILQIIHMIGDGGARARAMEFTGDTVDGMSVEERMTLCCQTVEAGAKNGIVRADDLTLEYLGLPRDSELPLPASDPDAEYAQTFEIDATTLPVTVSAPSSPSNAHPIEELAGIKVDQVVLGGCTNGRIGDFRLAATMLRGKKVADTVRMIVVPATPQVHLQALREGLIEIFVEAGAVVGPPGCGPCSGTQMGVLGPGEVCLTTTSRNFPGRMGALDSQVYLGNGLVAAATAITGAITHPREVA